MQIFVFVFVALCCFAVAKAIDYDCLNKYRTINAYEKVSQVNVSCYSSKDDFCNLLYAPPGTGCDANAISMGAVNAGETITLPYQFELGGAICSNYQIDVNYLRYTTLIQWPRATDAGYKFSKVFSNPIAALTNFTTYRITVSILSEPAELVYTTSLGETENLTLTPFTTKLLDQEMYRHIIMWVSITSNVPIVVTYADLTVTDTYYYVWQKLSADPVLLHVPKDYSVAYAQFTCDTNSYMVSSEDLVIETGSTLDSSCNTVQTLSDHNGSIIMFGEDCTVSLAPNKPNVCVSASLYASWILAWAMKDMALPYNKLASRLVSNGLDTKAKLISGDSTQCHAHTKTGLESINFNPLQSTVEGKGYYGITNSSLNAIERIECSAPVYFIFDTGSYSQNIASSGQISDDLWDDFFTTKACLSTISSLSPSIEEINISTFSPPKVIIPPGHIVSSSPKTYSVSMSVFLLGLICNSVTNNIY